jgi:hypothetical protein
MSYTYISHDELSVFMKSQNIDSEAYFKKYHISEDENEEKSLRAFIIEEEKSLKDRMKQYEEQERLQMVKNLFQFYEQRKTQRYANDMETGEEFWMGIRAQYVLFKQNEQNKKSPL